MQPIIIARPKACNKPPALDERRFSSSHLCASGNRNALTK